MMVFFFFWLLLLLSKSRKYKVLKCLRKMLNKNSAHKQTKKRTGKPSFWIATKILIWARDQFKHTPKSADEAQACE